MMTPSEIAYALDTACDGASSFVEIGGQLERAVQARGDEPSPEHPLAAFVAAFRYDLAGPRGHRRDEYGPFQ
jgi:hypothetical protein